MSSIELSQSGRQNMPAVRLVETTPSRVMVPPPNSVRSMIVPVPSAVAENFPWSSVNVMVVSNWERSIWSPAVSKSVMVSLPCPLTNAKVSAPLPPVSVSSPAPSMMRSSPAPASMVSLPEPPTMKSSPAPPSMVSSPDPPSRVSAPLPPSMVSSPLPPRR